MDFGQRSRCISGWIGGDLKLRWSHHANGRLDEDDANHGDQKPSPPGLLGFELNGSKLSLRGNAFRNGLHFGKLNS